MEVVIVRQWENKDFKFGINIQGILFIEHKQCQQIMSMIDIKIEGHIKKNVYGCSKCGAKYTQ